MRSRLLTVVVLTATAALAPAAQAAVPDIHAHRGGAVLSGVFAHPENTRPAFEAAAARGDVLEVDAKLTAGGDVIVLHDATLDRTTICSGAVTARTLSAIVAGCPSDVLGSPGSSLGGVQSDSVRVPLSSLAEILQVAKVSGARLNVEIKNVPTDADFDPAPGFANRVVDVLAAAGLAPGQLIVQSFWPPNLDVVEQRLPQAATSLLTLNQLNDGAPLYAKARGYEWVSPQWPMRQPVIDLAHQLGLRVAPWTLNTPSAVQGAAAAGADAIITDDPPMARAALGL